MKHAVLICTIALTAMVRPGHSAAQTQQDKDGARVNDLRLASYVTSRQVEQFATDPAVRTKALQTIRRMGITKLYLEVYRGGHVVSPEHLIFARDWLKDMNIEIVGGIATVPGGDFGVRQKGPLGWFNWQNEKTQRDLEKVIRMAAGIFDTFIVDDFLCTGDVSDESKAAKGDRSWGHYRRALLTELASSVFIGPAKEVNPDIIMIVKYPQWYDRFHLFGYDTKTLPELFDMVWVGTETRGRNTQRFGFVQPYEGFVNYRWLADIAGDKIGGAWFDHGDCAEHDFIDQAYTSVLAGASELVFFNFSNVLAGHPDHEKVIAQYDRLADLAAFVHEHPVTGIPAYKPPNSDPAGDMYIMDFLGMLGIPLVPVHKFPAEAPVIFLPAQAAADPLLAEHMNKALARGAQLIVTTNLLIVSPDNKKLTRMLDINPNIESKPIRAEVTWPINIIQEPGREHVNAEIERLFDMERFRREHYVTNIYAYTPPNSNFAKETYLWNFSIMMQIPIKRVDKFPEEAQVIFLPVKAAADPLLLQHVEKALARDAQIFATTSLLFACPDGEKLARMIGVDFDPEFKPSRAQIARLEGNIPQPKQTGVMIDLESYLEGKAEHGNIVCTSDGKQLALLALCQTPHGHIALLNTHTYSQADFDAVGEVLLCPRPLGLLSMGRSALVALRVAFGCGPARDDGANAAEQFGFPVFDGPNCVTFHPFGSGSCVIQNFNDKAVNVTVTMRIEKGKSNRFVEVFTGRPIAIGSTEPWDDVTLHLSIPARSRIWIRRVD